MENIPNEFSCKNCGKCCGPVPITPNELRKIEKYLAKRPKIKRKAASKGFSINCVFRDEATQTCMIYPCRPKICKIFRCSDRKWENQMDYYDFTGVKLINEVFGDPHSRSAYKHILPNFIRKL